MIFFKRISSASAIVLVASASALLISSHAPAQPKSKVRIGMVKSIFRDVSPRVQKTLLIPFGSLMYTLTGVNGAMKLVDDAFALGEKMEKKEIQLGVMHGYEFAWVQQKYPKLKPLMIAVNRNRHLKARVMVRKDAKIADFSDLRGKNLSVPLQSRAHCWLFVNRQCETHGLELKKFFGKVERHANIEIGLDDVIRGRVDSIVVDGVSLDYYRLAKPGCYRRLKSVTASPKFPCAVIVYRDTFLDRKTRDRFRKGMLNANKNFTGRQLMRIVKLTAFEDIPDDYQKNLGDIRAVYPAPNSQTGAITPNGKSER